MFTTPIAGDQLSNPLVDFYAPRVLFRVRWGSTLKPPGRLPPIAVDGAALLGINSQTPW